MKAAASGAGGPPATRSTKLHKTADPLFPGGVAGSTGEQRGGAFSILSAPRRASRPGTTAADTPPSRAAVIRATAWRGQEPAGLADPERRARPSERVDGERGSHNPPTSAGQAQAGHADMDAPHDLPSGASAARQTDALTGQSAPITATASDPDNDPSDALLLRATPTTSTTAR